MRNPFCLVIYRLGSRNEWFICNGNFIFVLPALSRQYTTQKGFLIIIWLGINLWIFKTAIPILSLVRAWLNKFEMYCVSSNLFSAYTYPEMFFLIDWPRKAVGIVGARLECGYFQWGRRNLRLRTVINCRSHFCALACFIFSWET